MVEKRPIIYCKNEDEKINKLLKHNTENTWLSRVDPIKIGGFSDAPEGQAVKY